MRNTGHFLMRQIFEFYQNNIDIQLLLLSWGQENIVALQFFCFLLIFFTKKGLLFPQLKNKEALDFLLEKDCTFINHPDVQIFLEEDIKQLSVQKARDLVLWLQEAPSCALYRIVMMENIEHLPLLCSNVFLKIFEEPSALSRFILTTKSPHSILPTLRSRLFFWPMLSVTKNCEEFLHQWPDEKCNHQQRNNEKAQKKQLTLENIERLYQKSHKDKKDKNNHAHDSLYKVQKQKLLQHFKEALASQNREKLLSLCMTLNEFSAIETLMKKYKTKDFLLNILEKEY